MEHEKAASSWQAEAEYDVLPEPGAEKTCNDVLRRPPALSFLTT
jgi:hypothetical protein